MLEVSKCDVNRKGPFPVLAIQEPPMAEKDFFPKA